MGLETKGNTRIAGVNSKPKVQEDISREEYMKAAQAQIYQTRLRSKSNLIDTPMVQSSARMFNDVHSKIAQDAYEAGVNYTAEKLGSLENELAKKQTVGDYAWNTFAGTTVQALAGLSHGLAGTISFLDSNDYAGNLTGLGENQYGDGLLSGFLYRIGDSVKDYANNFQVYSTDEDKENKFNAAYWSNQIQNLGYSGGLVLETALESYLLTQAGAALSTTAVGAVPGAAMMAAGLARGARIFSILNKLGKAGKVASFLGKSALVGAYHGTKEVNLNAYHTQNEIYNDLVNKGINPDAAMDYAVKGAAKQARDEFLITVGMSALTFGLMGGLGKAVKFARGGSPFNLAGRGPGFEWGASSMVENGLSKIFSGIKNPWLRRGTELAVQMTAEGFEEAYQAAVANNAKNMIFAQLGFEKRYDSILDGFSEPGVIDEAIGGALGGAFFYGTGKVGKRINSALNRSAERANQEERDQFLDRMRTAYQSWGEKAKMMMAHGQSQDSVDRARAFINRQNAKAALAHDYKFQTTEGYDAYIANLNMVREHIATGNTQGLAQLGLDGINLTVEQVDQMINDVKQYKADLIEEYNNTNDDFGIASWQLDRRDNLRDLRAKQERMRAHREAVNTKHSRESFTDQENELLEDMNRSYEMHERDHNAKLEALYTDTSLDEKVEQAIEAERTRRKNEGEAELTKAEEAAITRQIYDDAYGEMESTLTPEEQAELEEIDNRIEDKRANSPDIDAKRIDDYVEELGADHHVRAREVQENIDRVQADYDKFRDKEHQHQFRLEQKRKLIEEQNKKIAEIKADDTLSKSEKRRKIREVLQKNDSWFDKFRNYVRGKTNRDEQQATPEGRAQQAAERAEQQATMAAEDNNDNTPPTQQEVEDLASRAEEAMKPATREEIEDMSASEFADYLAARHQGVDRAYLYKALKEIEYLLGREAFPYIVLLDNDIRMPDVGVFVIEDNGVRFAFESQYIESVDEDTLFMPLYQAKGQVHANTILAVREAIINSMQGTVDDLQGKGFDLVLDEEQEEKTRSRSVSDDEFTGWMEAEMAMMPQSQSFTDEQKTKVEDLVKDAINRYPGLRLSDLHLEENNGSIVLSLNDNSILEAVYPDTFEGQVSDGILATVPLNDNSPFFYANMVKPRSNEVKTQAVESLFAPTNDDSSYEDALDKETYEYLEAISHHFRTRFNRMPSMAELLEYASNFNPEHKTHFRQRDKLWMLAARFNSYIDKQVAAGTHVGMSKISEADFEQAYNLLTNNVQTISSRGANLLGSLFGQASDVVSVDPVRTYVSKPSSQPTRQRNVTANTPVYFQTSSDGTVVVNDNMQNPEPLFTGDNALNLLMNSDAYPPGTELELRVVNYDLTDEQLAAMPEGFPVGYVRQVRNTRSLSVRNADGSMTVFNLDQLKNDPSRQGQWEFIGIFDKKGNYLGAYPVVGGAEFMATRAKVVQSRNEGKPVTVTINSRSTTGGKSVAERGRRYKNTDENGNPVAQSMSEILHKTGVKSDDVELWIVMDDVNSGKVWLQSTRNRNKKIAVTNGVLEQANSSAYGQLNPGTTFLQTKNSDGSISFTALWESSPKGYMLDAIASVVALNSNQIDRVADYLHHFFHIREDNNADVGVFKRAGDIIEIKYIDQSGNLVSTGDIRTLVDPNNTAVPYHHRIGILRTAISQQKLSLDRTRVTNQTEVAWPSIDSATGMPRYREYNGVKFLDVNWNTRVPYADLSIRFFHTFERFVPVRHPDGTRTLSTTTRTEVTFSPPKLPSDISSPSSGLSPNGNTNDQGTNNQGSQQAQQQPTGVNPTNTTQTYPQTYAKGKVVSVNGKGARVASFDENTNVYTMEDGSQVSGDNVSPANWKQQYNNGDTVLYNNQEHSVGGYNELNDTYTIYDGNNTPLEVPGNELQPHTPSSSIPQKYNTGKRVSVNDGQGNTIVGVIDEYNDVTGVYEVSYKKDGVEHIISVHDVDIMGYTPHQREWNKGDEVELPDGSKGVVLDGFDEDFGFVEVEFEENGVKKKDSFAQNNLKKYDPNKNTQTDESIQQNGLANVSIDENLRAGFEALFELGFPPYDPDMSYDDYLNLAEVAIAMFGRIPHINVVQWHSISEALFAELIGRSSHTISSRKEIKAKIREMLKARIDAALEYHNGVENKGRWNPLTDKFNARTPKERTAAKANATKRLNKLNTIAEDNHIERINLIAQVLQTIPISELSQKNQELINEVTQKAKEAGYSMVNPVLPGMKVSDTTEEAYKIKEFSISSLEDAEGSSAGVYVVEVVKPGIVLNGEVKQVAEVKVVENPNIPESTASSTERRLAEMLKRNAEALVSEETLDAIYEEALSRVKTLTAARVDESFEEVEEDDQEGWEDQYDHRNLPSLSARARAAFSAIPMQDRNGNPMLDELGLPVYLDFEDVYDMVQYAVAFPVSIPSSLQVLINRVYEASKYNPELLTVVERLNKIKAEDPRTANELIVAFTQNVSKPIKVKGRRVVDLGTNGVRSSVRNAIKQGFMSKFKTEDDLVALTSGMNDEFIGIINNPNLNNLDKAGMVIDMLRRLGIALSPNSERIFAQEMADNANWYFGTRQNPIQTLLNLIASNKHLVPSDYNKLVNIVSKSGSLVSHIINLEGKVNIKHFRTYYFDGGKMISVYANPRMAEDVVNQLKRDPEFMKDILSSTMGANSLWANLLYKGSVDPSVPHAAEDILEKIRDAFNIHPMAVESLSETGKHYTQLSSDKQAEVDRVLYEESSENRNLLEGLNQGHLVFTWKKMMLPSMSDKKQSFAVNAPAIDFDAIRRSKPEYQAEFIEQAFKFVFEQSVVPELNRILEAFREGDANLLKAKHVKKFFYLNPILNTLMIEENGVTSNIIEHLQTLAKANQNPSSEVMESLYNAFKEQFPEPNFEDDNLFRDFGIKVNQALTTANFNSVMIGDAAYFATDKQILGKNSPFSMTEDGTVKYDPQKANNINSVFAGGVYVNLNKRMGMLTAQGRVIAESQGDEYVQIALEDIETVARNFKELYVEVAKTINPEAAKDLKRADVKKAIKDLSSKDKNKVREAVELLQSIDSLGAVSPFLTNATTDAQEYTTAKEHLDVMFRSGKMDYDAYKTLSAKIEAQTQEEAMGMPISEENLLTRQEIDLFMQPLKPVYASLVKQADGSMMPVYVKSSSIPLLPQVTAGLEIDKLRKLLERVQRETGKNVRASYQTANKVGAPSKGVNVWNGRSFNMDVESLSTDDILANHARVLPRSGFRIQIDTPEHTRSISLGTQILKSLLGNGNIEIDENYTITDGKGNKVDVTGLKLQQKIHNTLKDLIRIKTNQVMREFGFNQDGRVNKAEFVNKVKDILVDAGHAKGFSLNEINMIEKMFEHVSYNELTGQYDFNIPIDVSPMYDVIQRSIMSYLNKRIFALKLPGYSFIAASEMGFRTQETTRVKHKAKKMSELSDSVKSKIVWTSHWTGELRSQTVTDQDGKAVVQPATVLMPAKYEDEKGNLIEFIDKNGNPNPTYVEVAEDGTYRLKEDMIEPELLQRVSFRIPTSSLISIQNIAIAGFLPREAGDMIVVPDSFTTQKGMDFDVDKEYTYGYHLRVNADGKIVRYRSNVYRGLIYEGSLNPKQFTNKLSEETSDAFLESSAGKDYEGNMLSEEALRGTDEEIANELKKLRYIVAHRAEGLHLGSFPNPFATRAMKFDNGYSLEVVPNAKVASDAYKAWAGTDATTFTYQDSKGNDVTIDLTKVWPEHRRVVQVALKQKALMGKTILYSGKATGVNGVPSHALVLNRLINGHYSENNVIYKPANAAYLDRTIFPEHLGSVSSTFEVSSKGNSLGQKFSALKARVHGTIPIYSKNGDVVHNITLEGPSTIEAVYQALKNAKYDANNVLDLRGYNFTTNKGKSAEAGSFMKKFVEEGLGDYQDIYTSLWRHFLDDKANEADKQELIKILEEGYRLTDKFAKRGAVNQADTLMALLDTDKTRAARKALNENQTGRMKVFLFQGGGLGNSLARSAFSNKFNAGEVDINLFKFTEAGVPVDVALKDGNLDPVEDIKGENNPDVVRFIRDVIGEEVYDKIYNKPLINSYAYSMLNSDAIYIIGETDDAGIGLMEDNVHLLDLATATKVNGNGKPVFVYNPISQSWFMYDYNTKKLIETTGVPPMSNSATVIGTTVNPEHSEYTEEEFFKTAFSGFYDAMPNSPNHTNHTDILPIFSRKARVWSNATNLELESLEKHLKNELVEYHAAVTQNSSMHVQSQMGQSLSMDFARANADIIGNINASVDVSNLSDPTFQRAQVALGSFGKDAISAYSSAVVQLSLLQQFTYARQQKGLKGVFLEDGGKFVIKGIKGKSRYTFDFDNEMYGGRTETIDGTRRLTKVFEERQNISTDNGKEQILGRVGVDKSTVNIDIAASMYGLDMAEVWDESKGEYHTLSIGFLLSKMQHHVDRDVLKTRISELTNKLQLEPKDIKEGVVDMQAVFDLISNGSIDRLVEQLSDEDAFEALINIETTLAFTDALKYVSNKVLNFGKFVNIMKTKMGSDVNEAREILHNRYATFNQGSVQGLDEFIHTGSFFDEYLGSAAPLVGELMRMFPVRALDVHISNTLKNVLGNESVNIPSRSISQYMYVKGYMQYVNNRDNAKYTTQDLISPVNGQSLGEFITDVLNDPNTTNRIRRNDFLANLSINNTRGLTTIGYMRSMTVAADIQKATKGLQLLLGDNTVVGTWNGNEVTASDMANALIDYIFMFSPSSGVKNLHKAIPAEKLMEMSSIASAQNPQITENDIPMLLARDIILNPNNAGSMIISSDRFFANLKAKLYDGVTKKMPSLVIDGNGYIRGLNVTDNNEITLGDPIFHTMTIDNDGFVGFDMDAYIKLAMEIDDAQRNAIPQWDDNVLINPRAFLPKNEWGKYLGEALVRDNVISRIAKPSDGPHYNQRSSYRFNDANGPTIAISDSSHFVGEGTSMYRSDYLHEAIHHIVHNFIGNHFIAPDGSLIYALKGPEYANMEQQRMIELMADPNTPIAVKEHIELFMQLKDYVSKLKPSEVDKNTWALLEYATKSIHEFAPTILAYPEAFGVTNNIRVSTKGKTWFESLIDNILSIMKHFLGFEGSTYNQEDNTVSMTEAVIRNLLQSRVNGQGSVNLNSFNAMLNNPNEQPSNIVNLGDAKADESVGATLNEKSDVSGEINLGDIFGANYLGERDESGYPAPILPSYNSNKKYDNNNVC